MKKAHIIILSGQSNAAGVAHHEYLKDNILKERLLNLKKGFDKVKIRYWSHGLYNDKFEPIVLTDNYTSCDVPLTFGPEIGIAEYLAKNINEEIFIAKYAYGGATLDFDFCPPNGSKEFDEGANHAEKMGWAYDGLIKLLKDVILDFKEKGIEPVFDAFMWMQGEGDAITNGCFARYKDQFIKMIDGVKKEIKDYIAEDFKVIDAGIKEGTFWTLAIELNELKRSLKDNIPNYIFLDTNKEGLTTNLEPIGAVDPYHYDCVAMLKLGNMFAEAYLK